jgi:hypothetical protein
MTICDTFTMLVKSDFKSKGITYAVVAEKINMSERQFIRHIKGDTKERIMPVRTVADLRRENLIGEDTVEMYWQGLREELRFKKRKTRWLDRILGKLIKTIVAQR